MNPLAMLSTLVPWLDSLPDWSPTEPEPGEVEACQADRCVADDLEDPNRPGEPPIVYPVVDLEAEAARVRYANGKIKRTRYPRVDLSTRRVVIGLHQAGVERSEARWSKTAHRVTCHRGIGPAGNRYRVHPLDRRIVCTNRVDRAPWHCIGIEVLGNFEGVEGSGRWYKPEVFGRGRLGEAQLQALRQEITDLALREVPSLGGEVVGILPHRVTGRNSRGKPNRPICCGSAIWSRGGEWAAARFGLQVPGPGWALGGLPVEDDWHGPHWPDCDRRFAA